MHLDERRVRLDQLARVAVAPRRTARSPRRSRRRRRARCATRPRRCARCSRRGPPSRSRGPSRGACARCRRRGGRRRSRARSSSGSTMSASVVFPAPDRPVNQRTKPLLIVCSPHSVFSDAGPAALAADARDRRVRVADRRVALVVQRVVRQPALADVRPAVVVAPVGERVRLPQLVLRVPAELRRVGACRRLVAADAGDPRVEVEQRAVQRLELRDREIEVGVLLPELVLDRARPRTSRSSCRTAARPRARARRSPGRGSPCRARRRAPSSSSANSMSSSTVSSFWNEHASATLPGKCSTTNRSTSSADIDSTSGGSCSVVADTEHLLERVAAQPETKRLERDDFLGRDVAEVHVRAEVAARTTPATPSSAPPRRGRGSRPHARSRRSGRCASRRPGGRCRTCRPRALR